MIGLGTLAKLAKGGLGPDELGELLEAAGMKVDFAPVQVADALPEFKALAEATSLPDAKILRLNARMKGGEILQALLVVNQKS
jgi:hypothetical protein